MWLRVQVERLPSEITKVIVCSRTENRDEFSMPRIHSLFDESRPQYYWERFTSRLGFEGEGRYIAKTAREVGAQILHSHFGPRGWGGARAAKRCSLKHAVSFYGHDVTALPKGERRWVRRYESLFQQANRIISEGPFMARSLIELGAPSEKVVVHHLGVPTEKLRFSSRQWGEGEPLRILLSGRFQEKKGMTYAVDAVAKISKDVPVELTIVGDANELQQRSRQEKARVIAAIERGGLRDRTRLLGFQPHSRLMEEGYRHHVFLSPSVTASDGDAEGGLPYVMTELLATGMPVVSTRHCDTPELIEHGVTGLLADERDGDGLASNLRWLAEHPQEWRRLAGAGRARVEAEFNAAIQGERLAAIYRGMVES